MKTSINLLTTPNQSLSANITDNAGDTHIVDFNLRTLQDGTLIADLTIDAVVNFQGRRCVNKMPLMLNGFITGNFYFDDQYDNTDPVYTGFGTQYLLIYDSDYDLK